jgi:putative copper resistance protein D
LPGGLVLAAVLVPVLVGVVTTLRTGSAPYAAIASDYPGTATALASTVLRALVTVSSTTCIGGLVVALLLTPRRGQDRLLVEEFGAMSLVRGTGAVWGLAAAALVLVDAANSNGQPFSRLLQPGGLVLISGGYLARAWIVVAVCAGLVLVTTSLSRAWPGLAAALGVAMVGVLAPVLVEHVLVGPNHDFAGDAAILGVPTVSVWFGATAALFAARRQVPLTRRLMHRYVRLARFGWPVVICSQLVVALVETEGSPRWGTATGQLFGVQFAILIALAGLGTWWQRGGGRAFDAVRARRLLGAVTLLAAGYLGVDVALTRIPSPQFFVPTSITQNFLGYDVVPAPRLTVLAGYWRVNLLFVVLALVCVSTYLLGIRRLRRRGGRWPTGRAVAWVGGWALAVVTTSSGVGRYAGASFAVHMVLHMSLNMAVPALLVLGGPLTLALAVSPARPLTQAAGPHEWVASLLRGRLHRSLTHPLHALVAYTASYYLLYFTDIFDQASRYHWAHEVMNLEFIVVGYLFFSVIMGVDRLPRPVPPLAQLGLILAGMPFHAFFGVLVMTRHQVIAQTFYQYLQSGVGWITDLHRDQYIGGGIALAVGEIPLTFALVILLTRWSRQDRASDAASHARADRVDEGDLRTAHDELLSRLAARSNDDGAAAGPTSAPPTGRAGTAPSPVRRTIGSNHRTGGS